MKTTHMIGLLAFALWATTGQAQVAQRPPTGSGVYLTVADYGQGKLALSVNCQTENTGFGCTISSAARRSMLFTTAKNTPFRRIAFMVFGTATARIFGL